jgi:hypothetical protein
MRTVTVTSSVGVGDEGEMKTSARLTTAREPRERGCSGSEMVEMRSGGALAGVHLFIRSQRCEGMDGGMILGGLTVDFLLIDRLLSQLLLGIRERLFAIKVYLESWVGGRREEGEDAVVVLGEGLWFTPPSGQLVDVDDCGICVFDCHFCGFTSRLRGDRLGRSEGRLV